MIRRAVFAQAPGASARGSYENQLQPHPQPLLQNMENRRIRMMIHQKLLQSLPHIISTPYLNVGSSGHRVRIAVRCSGKRSVPLPSLMICGCGKSVTALHG